MLACDLFAKGYNGEISVLYPKMIELVGDHQASVHHFYMNEYREEFDSWYNKGGQNLYDEIQEPILIDDAYFENTLGERWFLEDHIIIDPYGNAVFDDLQDERQFAKNTAVAFAMRSQTFELKTETEQRLADLAFRIDPNRINTVSFYNESTNSNRVLDETSIWTLITDTIFTHKDRLVYEKIAKGQLPDMLYNTPGVVNPDTKEQITYLDYFIRSVEKYERDQDILTEIAQRVSFGALLTEPQFDAQITDLMELHKNATNEVRNETEFKGLWLSDIKYTEDQLKSEWNKMTQSIGGKDKAVRQNFGKLYREFSDVVANMMIRNKLDSTQFNPQSRGYNPNYDPDEVIQKDIGQSAIFTKSIMDFGDENLAMQRLGQLTSRATGKSENEISRMKYALNQKMSAVAKHYWAHQPAENNFLYWLLNPKMLFHRVEKHNRPYKWMLEPIYGPFDADDPFFNTPEIVGSTGKLIKRFSKDEEDVRKFVYEKDSNNKYLYSLEELYEMIENSDDSRNRRFLTSKEYQSIASFKRYLEDKSDSERRGFWLDYSESAALREVEIALANGLPLTQIQLDFQTMIASRYAAGTTITKKQERRIRFWENRGKHITARVINVQEDSNFFKGMQKDVNAGLEESRVKMELYDYIYMNSLILAEDNNNTYSMPMDRAFMPQLSMNVYESYQAGNMMGAYIKFVANLDNSELYEDYDVVHNSETKTWGEWNEYYRDPARTRQEKLRAPFILKKMYDELQEKWAFGRVPDPMNTKQLVTSLAVSNTMPFRTISQRKDFSTNMSRILLVHFESMIFRKNHNELLPLFQAAKTYYQNFGTRTGRVQDYTNVVTWIQDYTDRYFFGFRRGKFQNSIVNNMIDQAITATVLSYLSASPETSAMNLAVGLSEAFKQKVALHGWSKGYSHYMTGLNRILDPMGMIKNKGLSVKGKAFIEHFNLETFTNIDIENQQDFLFGITDKLMVLQQKSEVIIRGTSLLGDLTEAQWNSFTVSQDGFLRVTDPKNFPTVDMVKEWNYYVSSVQGNYTPEGRRNYHNIIILKAAMTFKTWMVDYVNERFKPLITDMYGVKRQGYYLTFTQVMGEYLKVIGSYRDFANVHGKLEPYQVQNLRKIVYDIGVYTLIMVGSSLGNEDEDPAEIKYIKGLLLRYQSQLYIHFYPSEVLKIVSRPFPTMGIIESAVGALTSLFTGDFEKSATLAKSTLPGHRLYDFAVDMTDLGE